MSIHNGYKVFKQINSSPFPTSGTVEKKCTAQYLIIKQQLPPKLYALNKSKKAQLSVLCRWVAKTAVKS
jgi:hypothetical protein